MFFGNLLSKEYCCKQEDQQVKYFYLEESIFVLTKDFLINANVWNLKLHFSLVWNG